MVMAHRPCCRPRSRLTLAVSVAPPAKSSKALSVTRMMMALDERRALCRALLGMLQAALPFEHRPARIIGRRKTREHAGEVDLPVAQRAEAAGALEPWLIAGIDALPAVRVELGILDVERLDALVIDVDEGQIVELHQHEMRWIVIDAAALVPVQPIEEQLEARAVENILAGMKLVADIDPVGVELIEDRPPRAASSAKAVSISPGGRCGQG